MGDSVLRIHFTAEDLARTRVSATIGAAAETMYSLRLLRDCASAALPFRPWQASVRGRLDAKSRPFTSLLAVDGPDIDLTMLMGDTPSVEEGIDNLLRASPARLLTEFKHIDFHPSQLSWARNLAEGDLEARRHFAAGLAACNEAIVAPSWNMARSHMEGVRATFARTLLDGGVERLLEGLCVPLARWRAPVLEVHYHRHVDVHLGGAVSSSRRRSSCGGIRHSCGTRRTRARHPRSPFPPSVTRGRAPRCGVRRGPRTGHWARSWGAPGPPR